MCDPGTVRVRRRLPVDRDDLEARLSELSVEVRLRSGEILKVRELDDLEPDAFLHTLPSFDGLRSLRARLMNPKSFAAAAEELRASGPSQAEDQGDSGVDANMNSGDAPAGIPIPDDLFAAALEATVPRSQPVGELDGQAFAEQLAREIVAPFVEPLGDPRLPELLALVDRAFGEHVRAVLHDPAFRSVEDAWRGLHRLTRALETGPQLEVRLLDVSVEELLKANGASGLPVLGGGGEGARADLVVVLHRFDATPEDAELLAALAQGVDEQGGVLVADAHPRLAGCSSDRIDADPDLWTDEMGPEAGTGWAAARREHAGQVALVVNRLPMRMPYGPRGAALDSLKFDELGGLSRDDCPWGSGAWGVAELFGRTATDQGQAPSSLKARLALERQPLVLLEEHGEWAQVPCAEVELGDRAIAGLAAKGLSAIRCVRGADAVLVGPVVALNGAALGAR